MTKTTDIILSKKYEALQPLKVLLAGLGATAVMTAFMLIAPYIGLTDMNVGVLLGSFMGDSQALGWTLHAVIGIIMAFIYVQFFNHTLPVINDTFRGMLFGIIVFIMSQIAFTLISLTGFLSWDQKEGMALMVFGNCLAGMIYGAVLGSFFKNK
ncbi:MAG: hypothetical protein KA149_11605 [Chitinophagales bacterium]|nr:hypothetical protein [Chitinophagales bacterium]